MDLSIVFVNYKTEALLFECLRSIYAHTNGLNFECIIVDNHFIPGQNQAILDEFPTTNWIDSGGNIGFSKANNIGLQAAKGQYILFLNADTLLVDNSIYLAYEMRIVRPSPITEHSMMFVGIFTLSPINPFSMH
jgi:GT2 family glycosyltransferase